MSLITPVIETIIVLSAVALALMILMVKNGVSTQTERNVRGVTLILFVASLTIRVLMAVWA